jgi:RNA polymerase sigma-70 factor (ECF subfamily)
VNSVTSHPRTEVGGLEPLVARVQRGDREAFETLFHATHRLARKIAHSVVGPQLVDDAVQESYLLVFRKLPQLQDPAAFRGWLSRLVLHVCYRLARQQSETSDISEQEIPSDDQSEELLSALQLRQALARLTPRDREILILRELLELSYEEVGYALDLPVGTVRSRLHKARQHLAERLKL